MHTIRTQCAIRVLSPSDTDRRTGCVALQVDGHRRARSGRISVDASEIENSTFDEQQHRADRSGWRRSWNIEGELDRSEKFEPQTEPSARRGSSSRMRS